MTWTWKRRVATVEGAEVPRPLHDFIPVAEQWCIKNNSKRDDLLDSATTEDLRAFVRALERRCSEIDAWLDGLPKGMGIWPAAAVTVLGLRKTWHEAACELDARDREGRG
jgi:hypothetical protein